MNQPKKFFISHANDDKEIAELIASLLKKITLEQILPWFSSDSSSSGGIAPGSIWFNEILGKIEQSRAVVALLTPNSIMRPWVYFECGIAQSLKDCEVIPACVGTSRDKIYPPLGLYQCYQLSNYRSLKEFLEKILSKFEVKFDEELSKSSIEKTVSELTKFNFKEIKEDPKIRDLLLDIKSHIDKRFIEIWERPNINIVDSKIHSDSDISFLTNCMW